MLLNKYLSFIRAPKRQRWSPHPLYLQTSNPELRKACRLPQSQPSGDPLQDGGQTAEQNRDCQRFLAVMAFHLQIPRRSYFLKEPATTSVGQGSRINSPSSFTFPRIFPWLSESRSIPCEPGAGWGTVTTWTLSSASHSDLMSSSIKMVCCKGGLQTLFTTAHNHTYEQWLSISGQVINR